MAQTNHAWRWRSYQSSDQESCLQIFDSNTPQYFIPAERQNFEKYLKDPGGAFGVIESDEKGLAACGGYILGLDGGAATLCWGLVRKDCHGMGLGRMLLSNRLSLLGRIPQMRLIRLDTTQHGVEFFMKRGFKTYRITQHFFGQDLHRHEMYLILDEKKFPEIPTHP